MYKVDAFLDIEYYLQQLESIIQKRLEQYFSDEVKTREEEFEVQLDRVDMKREPLGLMLRPRLG